MKLPKLVKPVELKFTSKFTSMNKVILSRNGGGGRRSCESLCRLTCGNDIICYLNCLRNCPIPSPIL